MLVFVDYLTKQAKTYPTSNQTSETVTWLLVDNICHHGVSEELILDGGANLSSDIFKEVYEVCGMKKTNTTYHPQTDDYDQYG